MLGQAMNENHIQRSLGRIEAQNSQILEEQKRYRQENKEVKRQLESVKHRQEAAEKERASMAAQLETVKKNTDEFNKWKERGVGALMLISTMAALVGGSLAASWQKILDVFK